MAFRAALSHEPLSPSYAALLSDVKAKASDVTAFSHLAQL